jgi:hypothetical protein
VVHHHPLLAGVGHGPARGHAAPRAGRGLRPGLGPWRSRRRGRQRRRHARQGREGGFAPRQDFALRRLLALRHLLLQLDELRFGRGPRPREGVEARLLRRQAPPQRFGVVGGRGWGRPRGRPRVRSFDEQGRLWADLPGRPAALGEGSAKPGATGPGAAAGGCRLRPMLLLHRLSGPQRQTEHQGRRRRRPSTRRDRWPASFRPGAAGGARTPSEEGGVPAYLDGSPVGDGGPVGQNPAAFPASLPPSDHRVPDGASGDGRQSWPAGTRPRLPATRACVQAANCWRVAAAACPT